MNWRDKKMNWRDKKIKKRDTEETGKVIKLKKGLKEVKINPGDSGLSEDSYYWVDHVN